VGYALFLMNIFLEKKILKIDSILRLFFVEPHAPFQPNPAKSDCEKQNWSNHQYQQSKGQIRINHTGEICAQALYDGHYHDRHDIKMKNWINHAAKEEYDHLAWCYQRLKELNTTPSLLNPFFYLSSYCMARVLSTVNQQMNLSFIKETEKQVEAHLTAQLPLLQHDQRSCEIIKQMIIDERKHHDSATAFGGGDMPVMLSKLMSIAATAMKNIAFYF
jgi:ubiquinone biosynthesis monooxygenase Coq7